MVRAAMAVTRAVLLLRLAQRGRGRSRRCVDDALRAGDTPEVRDEESRRAPNADDRTATGDSKAVSHVEPGESARRSSWV